MEKSNFDLKKEYNKFVIELKKYHEGAAGYNDPEEFVSQLDIRQVIIGNISDLCNTFTSNSHWVLEAFDMYKGNMLKQGVNIDFSFFTELTNILINLVNEREEINKWSDQLYHESEYLKENKVNEMSIEDINNL